jgi:hypothetical protein
MRRLAFAAALIMWFGMIFSTIGFAAPKTSQDVPPLSKTLKNARYVYVTSYDGDEFNPNLLPEDRDAITSVQDAIQKWKKLILVYEPGQADIILRVQGRPSEDVLAVYDAHQDSGQFLWRVMGRSGLQKGEMPLLTEFEQAFEKTQDRR